MRKIATRVLAVTLAAAMALPVINLGPASAASPTPAATPSAKVAKPADDMEFSSRKRHYRHHRGNAAALGAVATVFGTIAALAAESRYRDRYYDHPYGYYGPYGYSYGAYPGGYYYYR